MLWAQNNEELTIETLRYITDVSERCTLLTRIGKIQIAYEVAKT